MTTHSMTQTTMLFLLFGYCSLLPGQASAKSLPLVAQPAISGQPHGTSVGYLEVHSATEPSPGTEGIFYFVHTGYRIYGPNGQLVKWVENHDNESDEAPQKIELAPGTYTVWGQSEKGGYVSVPVQIKSGRVTVASL